MTAKGRYEIQLQHLVGNERMKQQCNAEIDSFLKANLGLKLHPDKSKILFLKAGIPFLGYRNFYYRRLLKKSNIRKFDKKFLMKMELQREGICSYSELLQSLQGWFGYIMHANTFKLRRKIMNSIIKLIQKPNFDHTDYILGQNLA